MNLFSEQRRLESARRIVEHLANKLDIPFSVKLWDGSVTPLSRTDAAQGHLFIAGPWVLGSLLRRPSLDRLFQHYVNGNLRIEGISIIDLLTLVRERRKAGNIGLKELRKGFPWARIMPLFAARNEPLKVEHQLHEAEDGRQGVEGKDAELIQFHYDVSNEFYTLFLDAEMVYSCGYFTDWSNTLDQAQHDKLDLICRKLRLKPGESFLDIGSGWGALLCHAALNYGVRGHGVTLSQAQYDYAIAKIERLGLQDRVTVSLQNYMDLDGTYDKIASIGMYEHVGIDNYPKYFRKIRSLLSASGVFLNHGITRRAKRNIKNFRKLSAGKKVILKYIFPGSELDHIGHSVQIMESSGFDVYDVEGLRLHYGQTCRLWHDRLAAREEEAVAIVGPEQYRMWVAYLAGVSVAFEHGPLRIFQTVATRNSSIETGPLPPTRADIYRK
jgi:cyclopropane-fatty-acyl-phospholipid synthase